MYYGKVWYDVVKLITQLDNNSGDQTARVGEFYTGFKLNEQFDFIPPITFKQALYLLEPNKDGNVLRAAIPNGFDPEEMKVSRDQVDALIIAAGFYGEKEFISRVFWRNVMRGMRYENGDIMHNISTYIRAGYMAGYKWLGILRPVLSLFDVIHLANTLLIAFLKGREPGLVRRFLADKFGLYFFVQDYPKSNGPNNPDSWSKHGYNNVGDDILHTQQGLQMKKTLTTFVARLSNAMYAKFRPYGIQHAFNVYHDPKFYGNPLNELYRPIIAGEFYGDKE